MLDEHAASAMQKLGVTDGASYAATSPPAPSETEPARAPGGADRSVYSDGLARLNRGVW
jgi:hypothetical protein